MHVHKTQSKYNLLLTPLLSLHSLFIYLPSLSQSLCDLLSIFLFVIYLLKMLSINNNNNNNNKLVVGHHPPSCFSASQWQELEHQALVFKHMDSGIPVPPDLLTTSCSLLHNNTSPTHLIGSWNMFEMGRKIDTEPGRCRRTDGKKWRCSKEAYPDSKYCERHIHRGRNRSTSTSSRKQITPLSPHPNPIIKNTLPHFLSKYSSAFSSQQDVNFHFLQQPDSGSTMMRSSISSTDHNDIDSPSSSKLTMALMGNSSLLPYVKHNISTLFTVVGDKKQQHRQPEKVVHHFLDDRSPEDEQGSSPDRTAQLSISIPNYLHNFFTTPKWYYKL